MSSKTEKSDSRPRGGRLARRARSFKDDFLGRITQMRSPSGTRAGSPSKGSKGKGKGAPIDSDQDHTDTSRSGKDVDSLLHSVRLLSSALRYFQDVVEKNTLEMLPGSATVVLETVLTIHSVLRESLVNEQSSLMLSATNQVYQSLANLIRWSDNVLLLGDKALEKESVVEIVQAVQEAIKTLVQLSVDRLQNKDPKLSTSSGSQNGLYSPSKSESPHRNSLPDIPLTPREREILEQTQFSDVHSNQPQLHHSASSDSILSSGSRGTLDLEQPPPKPPLPEYREVTLSQSCSNYPANSNNFLLESAPPLPPKKKSGQVLQLQQDQLSFSSSSASALLNGSAGSISTDINHSLQTEWTSPLSQSPESLTPLSKSSASSLDSNLNHSADDLLSFSQQHKYMHHSQTHFDSCCEYGFLTTSASQTYSCELSSYSSKMTTTATSVSLHSGDLAESMNQLLTRLNHVTSSCEEVGNRTPSQNEPPALPAKLRLTRNRTLSQYDNVPQLLIPDVEGSERVQPQPGDGHSPHCPRAHSPQSWLSNSHAPTCPHHQPVGLTGENGKPPPLPPKKKTIMAYMQMFGSYSQPSESEFFRHSLHTYQVVQAEWQQQMELSFMHQHSFTTSLISSSEDSVFSDGPSSHSSLERSIGEEEQVPSPSTTPPALPPKKNRVSSVNVCQLRPTDSPTTPTVGSGFLENIVNSTQHSPATSEGDESIHWHSTNNDASIHSELSDQGALDELDAAHYLIIKKPGEDGPDIRGGTVDSLIVQATKATKNDFLYQEAFLTTYRTFITPSDLVRKLLHRYNKFIHMSDMRQRAARNAFALLVRVVDDMCLGDVQEEILQVLMNFIFQLVSRGDLMLARALRKKVVEKCEARRRSLMSVPILLPSMAVTTHQASLLDFKSESLAEQMTVLDADLFQKIEIPEVLLWAKEQKEELSPNLTTFTEHFNKMSYWARSRILEQEEARDRERYVVKFIKIMKYLRKLNNFNSYLAILSALDSAPIRRLEWQRNITEGLKEYCALIDSSSSFRAYRQALAETGPPCIPYIGLILQDLTFVHIGNSDLFSEGSVNFSKRWQQFNILDNMRRFKNCQYPFKRNDQIISFFNNFDDYLCEEAMWQISETIKPRGGKKKNDQL